MLTMYDSVTVSDLPTGADAYLGYANGHYRNLTAVQARFPGIPVLSVAVTAGVDADVLDIEKGDAIPSQAPVWVRRQNARGVRPVVYANRSTMPAVIKALSNVHIDRSLYRVLSAHYDGAHICSPSSCRAGFTADGTQWSQKGILGNGHYDTSWLSETFLLEGDLVLPADKQDIINGVASKVQTELNALSAYFEKLLDSKLGALEHNNDGKHPNNIDSMAEAIRDIQQKVGK